VAQPKGEIGSFLSLAAPGSIESGRKALAHITTAIPANHIRLHYYRPDRGYASWTVYAFGDTTEDAGRYDIGPVSISGADDYGAFYDVGINAARQDLGFIVHNVRTGEKDPGTDMHLDLRQFTEAWLISGDATVYTSEPPPAQILDPGFWRLQAFWIDRAAIAIEPNHFEQGWRYALMSSPDATLAITPSGTLKGETERITLIAHADGLTDEQRWRFPQLANYAVFRLPEQTPVDQLKRVLKGQLAVAANDAGGQVRYLTGVQQAGVIDDLFYYPGGLGVIFRHFKGSAESSLRICVWAPTAQSVKLLLYTKADDVAPESTIAMQENNGTWSATGDSSWLGKYYLYSVVVYVPGVHQILENVVTDPYSIDLALNGAKSRITDLQDARTKPEGWDDSVPPELRAKNNLSIYELHVRDFSANDASVAEPYRGTYLAFAQAAGNGMRHLRELAQAGLKAVHLLPTFHFGSVNEDKRTWKSPGDLSQYPPDSAEQQARIAAVQREDAYNWGYDPVHFLAPAGAYAFDPDERVKEYRQMIMGLHGAGLRVVQDQVFNHTISSGQATNSVLDKIVPGYYYRLDADGNVLIGSCCPDTASERPMMGKLMIDAVVQNAREYKIDGFRFDLMGLHFVYNMQNIAGALCQLTVERDGVDGSKVYLYGEGWEMAETANGALWPNASQRNMYGCGVGLFNDRMRDGIRGGSPFADQRIQGFTTGLFTAPSEYTDQNQSRDDQRAELLRESDWIKVSLAGNLRDFAFEDSTGRFVKGSQVNYQGQAAGYAQSPIETVNYCSVHDNQTLFDGVQLKSAIPHSGGDGGDSIGERVRRQVLAMSLVAFGQGIPLFMGGDDLLRSKDMDENSFDSGDWFNRLDFSYQSNNWGGGLPIAIQNQSHWPIMQPLLANALLKPSPSDIAHCRDVFRELLSIRESSLLFRMRTPEEVQANLQFLNNGPQQMPGLIVMKLDAHGGPYGAYAQVLAVFNATKETVRFQDDSLKDMGLQLHPVQAASTDPIVRESAYDRASGSVSVPGLTTAVFAAAV